MPNTASTPSAFRHSTIASTARTGATSFQVRSKLVQRRSGILRTRRTIESTSGFSGSCRDLCARHQHFVRELEVAAAAHAHLVGLVHDVPALLTAAVRLVALPAHEQGGGGAQDREEEAD